MIASWRSVSGRRVSRRLPWRRSAIATVLRWDSSHPHDLKTVALYELVLVRREGLPSLVLVRPRERPRLLGDGNPPSSRIRKGFDSVQAERQRLSRRRRKVAAQRDEYRRERALERRFAVRFDAAIHALDRRGIVLG